MQPAAALRGGWIVWQHVSIQAFGPQRACRNTAPLKGPLATILDIPIQCPKVTNNRHLVINHSLASVIAGQVAPDTQGRLAGTAAAAPAAGGAGYQQVGILYWLVRLSSFTSACQNCLTACRPLLLLPTPVLWQHCQAAPAAHVHVVHVAPTPMWWLGQ